MRHQVFAYYNRLSLDGKVEPLLCMDKSHLTYLVPFYDFENERSYFYCIECDYKIFPGQQMHDLLLERINLADPYPEDLADSQQE